MLSSSLSWCNTHSDRLSGGLLWSYLMTIISIPGGSMSIFSSELISAGSQFLWTASPFTSGDFQPWSSSFRCFLSWSAQLSLTIKLGGHIVSWCADHADKSGNHWFPCDNGWAELETDRKHQIWKLLWNENYFSFFSTYPFSSKPGINLLEHIGGILRNWFKKY